MDSIRRGLGSALTIARRFTARFITGRFIRGRIITGPFITTLLIGSMLAPPSRAQAAVDYSAYMRWAGAVTFGAPVLSAAFDGEIAVSTAGSACQVVNAAVPGYPVLLGELPLASASTRVMAVSGNYAYLEDDFTLTVVDLRQEIQPAPVGFLSLPSPGGMPGVVVGTRLYLARGTAGLYIIDVSVKSEPTLRNLLFAGEAVTDVAASNGRLALLSNGQTLRLLDLATPDAPTLLGSTTLPAQPGDMDVEGGLLAVSNQQNDRVQLFDLSNPSAIAQVGSLAFPIAPDHLDLDGTKLVASRQQLDEAYEVLVVDVSNPAAPILLGGCGTPEEPHDVRLSADRILVAGGSGGLGLIALGNGASPPLIGSFAGSFNTARGLDLVGTRAYFLEGALGRVHILDVTNPAAPIRLGGLTTSSSNSDLAVNGSLLAITIDLAGVDFWDVSSPAAPVFRSRYDTQRTRKVALVGTRAYVADDFGLYVLNVANPAVPTLLGSLHTSGIAVDVAVLGNIVYLAGLDHGVYVIDVTNVASPSLIGAIDTPGSANGLDLRGTHLAVADGLGGLRLYSVSSPSNPLLLGVAGIPGNALEVSIDGDVAYVADDASMLAVDLRDLDSPFVAGCGLPWDTIDLVASGGYVYVANASFGLRIVPEHLPPVIEVNMPTAATMSLVVAPNPSRGSFSVSLRPSVEAGASIGPVITWRLFDLAGRCVWRSTSIDGAAPCRLRPRGAAGSPLPSGTYFLRADTRAGAQVTPIELLR